MLKEKLTRGATYSSIRLESSVASARSTATARSNCLRDLVQPDASRPKGGLQPTTPSAREGFRLTVRRTRRVRFPPPSPPSTAARARPPLAFPLLALTRALHGVAPHIRGTTGEALSAVGVRVAFKAYATRHTARRVPPPPARNAPRRSRAVSPSPRAVKQTRLSPPPPPPPLPPQTRATDGGGRVVVSYLGCGCEGGRVIKGTDLRRTEIVCIVWTMQNLAGHSFTSYSHHILGQRYIAVSDLSTCRDPPEPLATPRVELTVDAITHSRYITSERLPFPSYDDEGLSSLLTASLRHVVVFGTDIHCLRTTAQIPIRTLYQIAMK
ncbi:hypothetical protein DFH09DRAFT_1408466 [Mycena vulgaris]|nr:hypothetical protein DFH09DRAFT_1408466 [Mycena vulgaris]